jgi:hypothetical protein
MMPSKSDFSKDDIERNRACVLCGRRYSINEYLCTSRPYFDPPYNFWPGCLTQCLVCWLGCNPDSVEKIEGHLLRDVGPYLGAETHLVVMPMARVIVESHLTFPNHSHIYPPGIAELDMLNVLNYENAPKSLASFQSEVSAVSIETLNKHATVAFPCPFDWHALWNASYKDHLEFIRQLSERVDLNCLNLIRYRLCSIDMADSLPGRAGQIASNHMMAGALLYNAARGEARIIGGDAFSHIITKGLGLPIEEIPEDEFPGDGEVGYLAQQGLAHYTAILETDSATAKFTQSLALLEFLAEPLDYMTFPDVAKNIARYVAKNRDDYERLKERFRELTSKKDPNTGKHTGYRTRIMHMGDRLDWIIPSREQRLELLRELDG